MSDILPQPMDERFYTPEKRKRFYLVGMTLLLSVIAMHFLLTNRIQRTLKEQGSAGVWFEYADGEAAVSWRNEIWFPAVAISDPTQWPSPESKRRLVRIEEGRPREICGLGAGQSWLMPRDDGLWIFSPDGVSLYDGEAIKRIQASEPPASDGPPVLWEGKPTFITHAGGAVSIRSLEDKEWRETASFTINVDAEKSPPELRLLVAEDALFVLIRDKKEIYAYSGVPTGAVDLKTEWRKVADTDGPWTAGAHDAKPYLLTFQIGEKQVGGAILLHTLQDGEWTETKLHEVPVPLSSMGASSNGDLRVLYQSVPWTLNLLTVADKSVTNARQLGRFFELTDPEIYLVLIGEAFSALLAVLLVVSFWGMMTSSRPPVYTLMGPPVLLASLPRRALALALDATLLLGPFGAGMLLLWSTFSNIETSPGMTAVIATPLVLGGLLWAAVGTLLLVFAQGRYGRTFGKWLLGIRVVSLELRPCGFWRSSLRTLFLVPDSWLSFTVAIALVAYTRHWQRLGDLFSRTIVIRDLPQPTNLAYIQSPTQTS
jgi:uncharacterized RDD family membrane protein YckC